MNRRYYFRSWWLSWETGKEKTLYWPVTLTPKRYWVELLSQILTYPAINICFQCTAEERSFFCFRMKSLVKLLQIWTNERELNSWIFWHRIIAPCVCWRKDQEMAEIKFQRHLITKIFLNLSCLKFLLYFYFSSD